MSSVPTGGNTLKNVIIGVLTTVVAYVIVHFIFDKKSSKEDFEKTKEATDNAWNSINNYVNYADENFQTVACFSCDEEAMKKELSRKIISYANSLRNLKENKTIDEKMLSIIDRYIDRFADMEPLYNQMFDSLAEMKYLAPEVQTSEMARIQEKYIRQIDFVKTRDTLEVNKLLADINKKYKTDFHRRDPVLEYQRDAIVHKWRIGCAYTMDFQASGKMTWEEDGHTFNGSWSIEDIPAEGGGEIHHLTIHLDSNQTFEYNILQATSKILILFMSDVKAVIAACPE